MAAGDSKEPDKDPNRLVTLIAHGGAGKTTLAESILHAAGATDRPGQVDAGTSILDHEPEEITRKITISAALAGFAWNGHHIDIIDTPGYGNFIEETKGCLRISDGAVVLVSAISGVKTETERLWKFNCEYEVPRIAFVNKMDRDRANFFRAIGDMEKAFVREGLAVQIPVGAEAGFKGHVDLVTMKAWTVPANGGRETEGEIPPELAGEAAAYRKKLVEKAAETDDALLEKYLDAGDLTEDEIRAGLRNGTIHGDFVPVLCGSALKGIGARALLDALISYLPGPEEKAGITPIIGTDPKGGKAVTRRPAKDESFSGLVFKTVADPFTGRLSFVRIYSGRLKPDGAVYNVTRSARERVGTVFSLVGKKQTPLTEAGPGQVVAIPKLKETLTGDTLADEQHPILFAPAKHPEPVISFALAPRGKADDDKVSAGIARILEEDPALRYHWDEETREMILGGMGQVHLEVALERLKRKFGVDVEMKTPKVPYHETIRGKARVQGRYKKQTGGHGQYGDCWLSVEPLPRGGGFEFVDKVVGGAIPRQYIPAVEKGVVEALKEGVLADCPIVDVRVTVDDGSYHTVDSSEMAFKIAGSMAVKKALAESKPVLLEPVMSVEVDVPDEALGAVIGDLNGRRGKVQGVDPQAGGQKIRAVVPMAEMLTYAQSLNPLTAGRGVYTMEFSHYEEIPSHLAGKIISARKGEAETARK